LGNHADAADCFQKTFLDAWTLSRREPVDNWSALVRRLATARALDLLRSRYRRTNRMEPSADPRAMPSRDAGPQEQAEEAELAERLRAALAELPSRQAEAFCLRWLDEMSYQEIGERLGMETNAVGVMLHRARKRLREILGSKAPQREDAN
jgi:RNA polymerase sigma-70 factor (ECF subfamily)